MHASRPEWRLVCRRRNINAAPKKHAEFIQTALCPSFIRELKIRHSNTEWEKKKNLSSWHNTRAHYCQLELPSAATAQLLAAGSFPVQGNSQCEQQIYCWLKTVPVCFISPCNLPKPLIRRQSGPRLAELCRMNGVTTQHTPEEAGDEEAAAGWLWGRKFKIWLLRLIAEDFLKPDLFMCINEFKAEHRQ